MTAGVRRAAGQNDAHLGYLFVLPAVVTLFVVLVFPLLSTFYWSVVTETRSGVTFAGLTYYREALASPAFWNAFRNSFVFTVASVVLHLVTAMPVALLLNERIPWKTAFRVIALIPWMFPVVVVGVLWAWLYHPQFGLFNDVALRLGLVRDTVPWLADPAYAMPAIILANLWRGYPYHADPVGRPGRDPGGAIRGRVSRRGGDVAAVPSHHLAEPSLHDRAGHPARHHLHVPALRPHAMWMTAGPPAGATEVLTTLVYKQSFQFFRNEYASAIAILMFLVMFCFSLGYVRMIRERGARPA